MAYLTAPKCGCCAKKEKKKREKTFFVLTGPKIPGSQWLLKVKEEVVRFIAPNTKSVSNAKLLRISG